MIGRIKAFCLHSLTIAWGYLLAITGSAMVLLDNIGDALGDPALKDQLGKFALQEVTQSKAGVGPRRPRI